MYITEFGRLSIQKINTLYKQLYAVDLLKKLLNYINLQHITFLSLGITRMAGLGPALARRVCLLKEELKHINSRLINNACATGLETVIETIHRREHNALCLCVESMSNAIKYYINNTIQDSNFVDGFICQHENKSMLDWAKYYNQNDNVYQKKFYTKYELDNYAFKQLNKYKQAQYNKYYTQYIKDVMTDYVLPYSLSEFYDKKSISDSFLSSSNVCFLADSAAYVKTSIFKNNALVKIKEFDYIYVEPKYTIFSSIDMMKHLLKKYDISDFNIFEIHDAFSNTGLTMLDTFSIDVDKINCYGSSVSIGHPIAVTGMRLIQHAIIALKEQQQELACVIIPSSGGVCVSMILQNI